MRPIPIVCFPFAGAGASSFRRMQEYPNELLRICPVQLPGREERFDEPAYTDVAAAVDGVLSSVLELAADSDELALFGHSLGAVLAYEAAHRLGQLDRPRVVQLFVSGSPGPTTQRATRATGLSDEDFLARVREFAGYTHQALEHPELRELLLPTLRADVEMHENYRAPSDKPLTVPVTSIRGRHDELVSPAQAAEWEAATTGACRRVDLPGNHMYLINSPADLVRLMGEVLVTRVEA